MPFSLSALPLNNEELVECENYLERRRHHVQEPITPSWSCPPVTCPSLFSPFPKKSVSVTPAISLTEIRQTLIKW